VALAPIARAHDFEKDGLFPLITWSAARRLTPATLATDYEGRLKRNHLFDTKEWSDEAARQKANGAQGSTAYISRLTVDHGEYRGAHVCKTGIAESDYAECMATTSLGRNDPEAAERVDAALQSGIDAFLAVVPPTMVSACVSVVDKRGRLLLLRRSLAVRTFPAQWTVGINETMKYNDEPGASEDFFALVKRGLHEELGLLPGDYGPITIGWLGWSAPAACFCLVASVRSRLDGAEIDVRREACHSVYEHDKAAWLPFTKRTVSSIVEGGACPDGSLRWSYLAPLVAREAWRTRWPH
jgi:hypothetical protein